MALKFFLSLIFSVVFAVHARPNMRSMSECHTLRTTFPDSAVCKYHSECEPAVGTFVAISPEGSYKATGSGLELYLTKPDGAVTKKDGINDKVADGATINSTFTMLYGKVTFEVSSPIVSGIVTAAILIADEHDEIDVELLGGDPKHWQTNIYKPASPSEAPMWGVFSEVENLPSGSIQELHTYTIDWNEARIIWSVDGKVTRTLTSENTRKNGVLHYPAHPTRIQLGIWDASSPAGTAQWARGPVNWDKSPERMAAVIKSVTVECS